MECIRPLKAGFDSDYNLTFSQKKFNKELSAFELPCRKCLACRLNTAREKAIRCVHEAQMHEKNIFLTLTYSEDHIENNRLEYKSFQDFMKRLRKHIEYSEPFYDKNKHRISYMVTGEYGKLTKRKHWHAIIFNYHPTDPQHIRTTERDELVYTSQELSNLWGKGLIEFGSVTLDSAGYVARYSAKQLTHGKDNEHDYRPIHKTSSKRAIGKSFLEKYHADIFNYGYVVLPNGQRAGIPRYYEDWYKETYPELYLEYLMSVKQSSSKKAVEKSELQHQEYLHQCSIASGGLPLTKKQVSMTILKQKFKQLQEREKQ